MGRAQGIKDRFSGVIGEKRGSNRDFSPRDEIARSDYESLKVAFQNIRQSGLAAKICLSKNDKLAWNPPKECLGYVTAVNVRDSFLHWNRRSDKPLNLNRRLRITFYLRPGYENEIFKDKSDVALFAVRELCRAGLPATWAGGDEPILVATKTTAS